MGWVAEELEALLDPQLYEQPPEEAWRRLKLRSRDGRFVAIVQALAAWREREAQRRDLPRARIIRDDILLEVAANRPQTVEELRSLERVNLDRESAAGVVAAIQAAMALPKDGAAAAARARRAAARHRPDGRPPARAPEAPLRGGRRGAAPGRQHRRPRGDRRRRRGRRAGAARLAARDLRRGRAGAQGGAPGAGGARPQAGGDPARRTRRHEPASWSSAAASSAAPSPRPCRPARCGWSATTRSPRRRPAARRRHGRLRRPPPGAGQRGLARSRTTSSWRWPAARRAARASFVSLGTRKVYAPSAQPADRDRPGRPGRPLRRARSSRSSTRWPTALGPRLTRLRLANIFGYERLPGRSTFLSRLLAASTAATRSGST